MAYVYPNTNLRLIRSCPLDPSYEHTIYFGSASDQQAYFAGLGGITLSNYSYQRVERGYIKVGGNAESAYTCNYLMFQNSAFGDKWFYAFITGVEYISDSCYYVYFELDVMQTYMFNYTVGQQYVLREHALLDTMFSNMEPESVDVGEYVINNQSKYFTGMISATSLKAVIATTNTNGTANGNTYDRMYSGCQLHAYDADDVASIDALLNQFADAPEGVVAMYACPGGICPYNGPIPSGAGGPSTIQQVSSPNDNTTLDGYKPKNRKMYTYPYNFFSFTTSTGDSLNLRYEFSNDSSQLQFMAISSFLQPCGITVFPWNYGSPHGSMEGTNNHLSISITQYPQLSWVSDTYKAWQAQNGVATAISSVTAGVGIMSTLGGIGGAGALLGSVAATGGGVLAVGAAVAVASYLAQSYKASVQADVTHGSPTSGSILIAGQEMELYGGRMSCEYHKARIIDEYFTRFGYATNRLKTPNLNGRPHWNFVQTSGFTLKGSVPAESARKICQIYDKGITFWNNGSEVGNYSLDNSPA